MSEDHLFTIKKFMGRVVWTPTWISNGHFAVLKSRVKLGTHLTSDDAVICAFPNAKGITAWDDEKLLAAIATFDGLRVEFTRSPWRHANAALFLDASGNAAWFDADYCEALKIDALFGPAPMFANAKSGGNVPFYDQPTIDEAAIVIMQMVVPVDWDEVAKTVAAATSIEPSRAEAFAGMPEVTETGDASAPSDEETALRDAFEGLRPKKDSNIESVTITVEGHEPVVLTAQE